MGDITAGTQPEVKEVTPEAKTPPAATPEKTVPESEYKNLQREISKREARIQELEKSHTSVVEIKDEVAKLREDNAALYDYVTAKLTQESETVPIKSKQDALRAEREARERDRISQDTIAAHQMAVNTLLKTAAINPEDEKLELARTYWKAGDFEKSVSEVRRIANEAKVSKDNTDLDTLVEERVRTGLDKALTDAGLKKFPSGQPSGQSGDYKELRQRYIENPRDPEVRKKWLAIRNSVNK